MAIPKELEGIWEGKLKVNAGIELRLALKVEKGKDGALKATLASPDQGANNIPISSIGLKDNVLTFESKIIGAKYHRKEKQGRDRVRRRVQPGRPQVAADAQEDGQDHRARPPSNAEASVPVPRGRRHVREQSRRSEAGGHADRSAREQARFPP